MTAALTEKPSRTQCLHPLANGLALTLAVALGLAAAPASAQWKWKDANGRVQYSDRPPPADISPGQVLQKPAGADLSPTTAVVIQPLRTPDQTPPKPARVAPAASAPSVGASTPGAADPARAAREKEAQAKADAERQKQEAEQARQRADNCTRARQNLRTLESGMRIARVNDKGEREYLSETQRAQEASAAQRAVTSDCR